MIYRLKLNLTSAKKCGEQLLSYSKVDESLLSEVLTRFEMIDNIHSELSHLIRYSDIIRSDHDLVSLVYNYKRSPVRDIADVSMGATPLKLSDDPPNPQPNSEILKLETDEQYKSAKFKNLILPLIITAIVTVLCGIDGTLLLLFVDPVVLLLVLMRWSSVKSREWERFSNREDYKRQQEETLKNLQKYKRLRQDHIALKQSVLDSEYLLKADKWASEFGAQRCTS